MTTEQKGLRLAALAALMGFGIAGAISAYEPLSGPMAAVLDAVFWPLDGAEGTTGAETRLLLAILGGITFGWGLMIWRLAGEPLSRDPGLIRPIIRNSLLAWFLVDSTGSFLAGAPLNVALNLVFLAMFLVPMRLGARQPVLA